MRQLYILMAAAVACGTMSSCRRGAEEEAIFEQTYVHKYGITVPQEEWADRGNNGQIITTLNNGVTETKSYSNGILDGESTYTFPYSTVIAKTDLYAQGRLIEQRRYYPGGARLEEIHYLPNKAKKITAWYENGSPQSIEEYDAVGLLLTGQYYDPRNQLDSRVDNREGTRTLRDLYGQLTAKEVLQYGEVTSRTTYHPNGLPKDVTPYQEGVVEGTRKSFLPGGEPSSVEQWVGGKQQGITLLFENGEKVAEVPYLNGAKHGVEKRFRGDVVVEEITWSEDSKHGASIKHLKGATQVAWFYQGRAISKVGFDRLSSHQ
jgi:antitoxin component YwqK of YwqJK toxin-antitoxin module